MVCAKCNHPATSHAELSHGVNSCQDCPAGKADHVFVAHQHLIARPEEVLTEYGTGQIVTLKCPCGWEAMYVLPEECFRYLIGVLGHVRDAHGTPFPEMEHRTL